MAIRINGVDRDSQSAEPSSFIHGARHLAANKNIYEPQRTSDFEFVITDLEGLVGMDGQAIPNAQELLRIAVKSTSIPHFSQEAITIRRGNGVVKFAGLPTFDEGSLVIQDWIGADTKEMLMAWQNLSYNVQTEKVGIASDYKKNAFLVEYSPDKQVVRRWILTGCWISRISEDGRSHDESSANSITATIQYDMAQLDTTEV